MLTLDTEGGTCHRVAIPGIYVWLGFFCLAWPLPPSVSGLVCGLQKEAEKSGKRVCASLSGMAAKRCDYSTLCW